MNEKLDAKDRRMLHGLSLNARMPLSALAKKLKTSKQAVGYRLASLERRGMIEGYYAVINPYALGMTHYRLFVKYTGMSARREQEFMDFLSRNPKVVWTAYLEGSLDAGIIIWANGTEEFAEVYDAIMRRFGKNFSRKEFSISKSIRYFKADYLTGTRSEQSLLVGMGKKKYDADEIDLRIIGLLSERGRMPTVELAQRAGVAALTARNRLRRLQREGVIVGFNVKINHKALGYTHRKMMLRITDRASQAYRELLSYLHNHPAVIYIVEPIGSADLEFEVMTGSEVELHEVIHDLRVLSSVVRDYEVVTHYYEPKVGQIISAK
ncbi:MAG: Lrp/AsnC family transcriptional regulator [Candidatus Burarchaeum sp.]|nr:Lrp/AsnC family transcriptional regulator [Candidatus Burarchaeum sp.]MDO8339097.1 Lrp/AsnC family transcriptional regulator [Candidatus Burarchaeum sp.]